MTRVATLCSVLTFALTAACVPTVGDPATGGDPPAGDEGTDASCAGINFTATPVIPSVQLLIDRSGSMSEYLPNTTTTRYQSIRDALVGSSGVVAELQAKANFGATLFTANTTCPELTSTASRGLGNAAQIQQLIDSNGPVGDTPTAESIVATVRTFQSSPPPAGSPPIIVLATDGLPGSCTFADAQAGAVTAVKAGYTAGIRTFILGIAGVNDTFLQDMANAGQGVAAGQPPATFYTANSATELKTAFQQVISGVVSCELSISGSVNPDEAKNGTVTLNGMRLTYGSDWELVGTSSIRLLGNACDMLKSGSSVQATVQASFPCGSVIL